MTLTCRTSMRPLAREFLSSVVSLELLCGVHFATSTCCTFVRPALLHEAVPLWSVVSWELLCGVHFVTSTCCTLVRSAHARAAL